MKSPPRKSPEQTPEEEGQRIIQSLLDLPDPPQTLEEDFLETSARITHRELGLLHRALQQQKQTTIARIAAKLEKYFEEHSKLTKEQRKSYIEAANALAKKQINELRSHTRELIQAAYAIQKLRDSSIRVFCREREAASTTFMEHKGGVV